MDDFDYYKDRYGKGHEKQEDINESELKGGILLIHEQSVKYLVMKNIKYGVE
ncbi:TPA: hypothetical protein QCJ58_003744 [Enterobacter asburiae]|nr:hypothetical protein [Enterobacter asburiae]HDR2774877.1 hypothetical protein [Enterobacter asburiae]